MELVWATEDFVIAGATLSGVPQERIQTLLNVMNLGLPDTSAVHTFRVRDGHGGVDL